MFRSSKASHASVFSVAGRPLCGSIWMKSEIGRAVVYRASSSRPSMCSGCGSRTARMVARPSGSREMVSGATGGGGPL